VKSTQTRFETCFREVLPYLLLLPVQSKLPLSHAALTLSMTMAPSAESTPKPPPPTTPSSSTVMLEKHSYPSNVDVPDIMTIPSHHPQHPHHRKTVAFAVNYEPSMVDRYYVSTKQVKILPNPTATMHTTDEDHEDQEDVEEDYAPSPSSSSNASSRRRSSREQKQRPVNMTTIRVRYDMEFVPRVERQLHFWDSCQTWPSRGDPVHVPTTASKSSKRTSNTSTLTSTLKSPCQSPQAHAAHFFRSSVVWIPHKRKDWEDSVSELTAVCTSAALRKHIPGSKKFVAPLSREYIRDRIDIDDPMRGYQIRHKAGGWLQGFLLWTNFTTWTHFFTWDSIHPMSGMKTTTNAQYKDADGSLAQELQALPRSGDPSDSGIVFQNIAEIGLLGGLGCGELLLKMALESIRRERKYKYVALQATDGSKKFYEKFGFVRVGAVCRYGTSNKGSLQSSHIILPTIETPIQGYRH
jgi:hypothetical protein